MIRLALLTQEQFLATFGESSQRIDDDDPPPFDFWPYFETIPVEDFHGYNCSAGTVEYVWRMLPGPFDHVLVNSENRNVFMALVLNREAGTVLGHRLLNLNREYGLDVEPA